jgi:hypothetical protein
MEAICLNLLLWSLSSCPNYSHSTFMSTPLCCTLVVHNEWCSIHACVGRPAVAGGCWFLGMGFVYSAVLNTKWDTHTMVKDLLRSRKYKIGCRHTFVLGKLLIETDTLTKYHLVQCHNKKKWWFIEDMFRRIVYVAHKIHFLHPQSR